MLVHPQEFNFQNHWFTVVRPAVIALTDGQFTRTVDTGRVIGNTGGDGVVRDMLKILGEHCGKQGVFEFIKESDGSINYRLFKPTSAE